MPLTINGKTFMNLQEAVAWLLANNALPFQSTANFVANTEIAKTTIINPSPAEIKIGSLVLFADGKVGTVSGITASGFMVGTDATDLSDGVPHITGITLDASDHLIFTMSEGDPIDAGLIKMVSSMSIDASQHLIVNYNDGSTNDLGAIFQGNINIAGNFTADSIIENMSGYSASLVSTAGWLVENVYTSVVKNGNKVTLVSAVMITKTDADAVSYINGTIFGIPASVGNALYPVELESGQYYLSNDILHGFLARDSFIEIPSYFLKVSSTQVATAFKLTNAVLNRKYYVRYEKTFLLNVGLI